ncbi:uncharacterized protein ldd [Battus philenor]|uniref:uncharacterized protein ldd n=1 Tax=Battus philenor TaxID=42288 RepID=UPI0035CF0837
MAASRQIRLLLWKDYLVRKRNPITLAGVVWGTAVIMSLYIVRINVDNQDFPTCQFPARALPSAGVMTFLQSFICSVNNECSPMDEFEEIPSYSNSKLTKLKSQLSPLFTNSSVMETAASVPQALKLLATLSDVADVPDFIYLTKNGLPVKDLFRNPDRVKRYLSKTLGVSQHIANNLMESQLSFEGVLEGDLDKCKPESVVKTIKMNNLEDLDKLVEKVCSLSSEETQKLLIDLLLDMDLGKYLQMLGNMYYKLSKDDRITELGKMADAVLRMMSLQSFLPPEITEIIHGETPDFSYIHLDVISNLLDYIEPNFGDTQSYKSVKDFANSAIMAIQYLNRFLEKQRKQTPDEVTDLEISEDNKGIDLKATIEDVSNIFTNAVEVFDDISGNRTSVDAFNAFNVISQITNFVYKWLPEKTKHDVLFYSTLITKLIEGAERVIYINVNLEELVYNVSLRHPEGVKAIKALPLRIFENGLDALADPERAQILTSKLDSPGEMFCDEKKLQKFFDMDTKETAALRSQLCTNAWKDYLTDLVHSFGIYEVRNNINTMASLFIQETLGKDTSSQLYTLDHDFKVLQNFTRYIQDIDDMIPATVNWNNIFNDNTDIMKIVRNKKHAGNQMLVTIHGVLTKAVVKQNPILEFKIAPFFIEATTIIAALNEEMDETPRDVAKEAMKAYPDMLRTILATALDEDKTYKLLSTFSEDAFCTGVDNASMYLKFPSNVDKEVVVKNLCGITGIFEKILTRDSHLGKAVENITSGSQQMVGIQWTKLITDLKNLHAKVAELYPYFLEYKTYGMDNKTRDEVSATIKEVKSFWFNSKNWSRNIRMSMKLALQILDLVDREIFNVRSDVWLQIKYNFDLITGPLLLIDDVTKLISALTKNETFTSPLPAGTVQSLSKIIPNIAQLFYDAVDLIVQDDTEIDPIIEIMNANKSWPCSTTSLADLLTITHSSKEAVRALESLMCMSHTEQENWNSYLKTKDIYKQKQNDGNTTSGSHVFLRFSAAFDRFIEDSYMIKDILIDSLDEHTDRLTLMKSWRYAIKSFNTTENVDVLRNLFSKMDTVLNSIQMPVKGGVPLISLWRNFVDCNSGPILEDSCREVGRATWLNIFKFLSLTVSNVADDLLTYFTEIHEPNSNLLQLLGFTKKTGLYMLYDKLPEFIGVLVNSYGDYGFMSQIRRAALSTFWDCEAVVKSLMPAPGSSIDKDIITKAQPYVCPSFLYWISLPRGDNAILDVVAKPQYYFFTSLVDELNSTFENAFVKGNALSSFINELSKNKTNIQENLNIDTIRGKLTKAIDIMLNYKINETNPSFRAFNEANYKLVLSTIYLTRVVTIINKVLNNIENVNLNDKLHNVPEEEAKKIIDDISTLRRTFKRKPTEAIAVIFDAITNDLWRKGDHNLIMAIKNSCHDTSKEILSENNKVKLQICSMNYDFIFNELALDLEDDFVNARLSLIHLVNVLKKYDEGNVEDISVFMKERKEVINYLKSTIKYAYDLGVPVYLKYLQNNLQHQEVIISFLSEGDWWQKLRQLYNGPYAVTFFDGIEKIFEIFEDIINNLDHIHWVRLIRDINTNSKEGFCALNTALSEYIPDETGALSILKQQFCMENMTELFKELMPLRFASQIYDNSLNISPNVDYEILNTDVSKIESDIDKVVTSPRSPRVPEWVTKEKLVRFRSSAIGLLSKETLTKVSFGLLANIVDAGTLLLNNSQCTLCSQFTTWFKQINLQLYKKQEYDNLLCNLHEMNLLDVYFTLKHDFHWDMAIKELISTRNYTKFELNKSMNEFLELTKQHLLEDMTAPVTKLARCLAQNVSRNAFGNATLFTKVLAHTFKLIRAELPHLQEIEGIKEVQYLTDLLTAVAHRLDVNVPLKNYLKKGYNFSDSLKKLITKENLIKALENSEVNIRILQELQPEDLVFEDEYTWEDLCECCDCSKIVDNIVNNLNTTLIVDDRKRLQEDEFWRFNFISNILQHIENIFTHMARLMGVVSKVDVEGVMQGRLVSVIDTTMQLLIDDTLNSIVYSIRGLITELTPLIKSEDLEASLYDLSQGLLVLQDIKNSLLEDELKVRVSDLFSDPDRLEMDLSNLGINNTNFWSIAAPRIQVGYFQFKPILVLKRDDFHISDFVCEMEDMAKVIAPGNLDFVTLEDVYGAVIEQFCDLNETTARQVVPVLLNNLNYTFIINKVKDWLLNELYSASNITAAEGEEVMENFPRMAALMPTMQNNVELLSGMLDNEPVLEYFKNDFSFDSLFGGGDFMADAGRMVCGKAFHTHVNRFFKSIVETKDMSSEADPEQLKVLPTDFCRTFYKQIVSIDGGKIVWSFVKPLVMGKILYTPSSPAVEKIIRRANESFAPIVNTVNLVHAFAKAFTSVETLSEHRDGLTALKDILTASSTTSLKTSLFGDMEIPDIDVEEVFGKLGGVQDLGGILQKGSDILECMNLNRFKPVSDEQHLSEEAARLMRVNEFSAGLVFLNNDTTPDVPLNVEYKIRMDIENTPTTNRLKNFFWIPGPEANFIDNMRYFRGFIQIQDIIDRAIIDVTTDNKRQEADEWAIYTQQMPYPCYRKDFFQTSLYDSQSLVVTFFFSLLFTTSSVVRFIVSDKETGNTVLMSVMGVNLSYHTLSWFLSSLVELLLTCTCVGAVLTAGGILPRTAPSMIFILLYIYAFSVLSFCYMLSKMFKAASFAAVCSGIAYLISFMPFVLILSLEALLTSSLKLLVCVSMSSSLCYAFLYIVRYEATGMGAQWAHLWESPHGVDDMSIGLAAILVAADGVLYILIGLLLDKLYGFKALKKSIISCSASGEKAGVSVLNVTKVYGTGSRAKLALDNVSVELHTGQITTLLGHNGAGKTTLIKILTGMLQPTQGHVVLRGERADGAGLGVCPQRDVLFRQLTAREHVHLYAQLKSGRDLQDLQDQIDSILRVLSLGPVADEPVSSLSGGTRRRLCVALAFVAEPRLVVLDEPTAGVDPAARRDIWSMILKLQENRTILLSTHHLDEAELLSDQIVIMHKGQVHTSGSPIEIKRCLGSGYKLTVMYPEKNRKLDGMQEILEEELSLEEKTKLLLATVRNVVKNANLVDVNGLEVEINLPFFDTDGVNNDYLQLCTVLEGSQTVLGFCNFSMDCCSLEQVFFNICNQASAPQQPIELETPSKSASTSSLKNDRAPLVPREGPLVGSAWNQFLALMYARYLHYTRNRSLLFMLLVLPSLFVIIAMAFSDIRPPPNNEFALKLHRDLYENTTEFLVKNPYINGNFNPMFAREIMDLLAYDKRARNWTQKDNPECKCGEIKQECNLSSVNYTQMPEMMLFNDTNTLNDWLITSQEVYIEKRYGGYSSNVNNSTSNLIAWYNNKGHHAMPAYLNALNNAVLRSITKQDSTSITTYTHPLKISKEPINKDTVYQHIADAGITAMILIAYSLVSAGGAIYLVTARCSQEKRLQMLAGVTPVLYWTTALVWDLAIIVINIVITAMVLQAFHFTVFVNRNNLPAICLLILLYGYGCAGVVHVTEKLFSQPSLANMILFCANTFVGIVGIAILLILDIISESDTTDNARWVLHKILMLSPQFVLGDGVLEIAKNTIQAQVLGQFGMDTYLDPLFGDLIVYHYVALILVGTFLFLLNLAIEYDCFEVIFVKFRSEKIEPLAENELDPEVLQERQQVLASHVPLRLKTIGNINAGFVDIEEKCGSLKSQTSTHSDVAQCVRLSKAFPTLGGLRVAVRDLTLGIPPGQCTALLGQNGAGKSTTFSMLTGQLRPSSGSIYLGDKRVNPQDLCKGLISYCPQSDAVDPLMTVRETLKFYCRLRGITDEDDVIRRTIEMFDLTKYRDVRSGKLSGGNKRKLCTAVAFMGRTPLVLLDEPTSGMDPGSRASVSRGVQRACNAGRGVLLSTHALDDARRLAARVALLQDGKLRALAPLEQCLRRFGGGQAVWWRIRDGGVHAAWRRLQSSAPHAQLQAMHRNALHFLLPTDSVVDGKQVTTKLSDVFRLTAELQSACDIEDFTVNQSSLDQMFLNFAGSSQSRGTDIEEVRTPSPAVSPPLSRRASHEDLSTVTAL